jgi:hypothetical protein
MPPGNKEQKLFILWNKLKTSQHSGIIFVIELLIQILKLC